MTYDQQGNLVADTGGYEAVPFDNGARLFDKMYGAVVMSIDNMTADIAIQNAKNKRAYLEAQGTSVTLPASISAWFTRNQPIAVALATIGAIFIVGILLHRR